MARGLYYSDTFVQYPNDVTTLKEMIPELQCFHEITWLSKHPQLFSDFRDDPHDAQVRVFNALKCAKLIAPTTAMIDTDVYGYMIEAEKCAKIRDDKQVAPH